MTNEMVNEGKKLGVMIGYKQQKIKLIQAQIYQQRFLMFKIMEEIKDLEKQYFRWKEKTENGK
jgi:hypothetical protein